MKYLVAIDFSENSRRALETCLRFAKSTDEVVLICAVEKIEKNLKNTLLVDFDFQIIDSANKHRLKEANHLIQEYALLVDKQKVPVRTVIESAHPREFIVAQTDAESPDMLFMGSRGLSLVSKVFLGSVSDYCVQNCKCPVTVVK